MSHPAQGGKPKPPKPTPAVQNLINAALRLPMKDQPVALAKAAEAAFAAKDEVGYDTALSDYRDCELALEQLGEAEKYLRDQVAISHRSSSPLLEATAVEVLGEFLRSAGREPDALALYEMALKQRTKGHDLYGQAECLHDLGNYYLGKDYAKALLYFQRELPLQRQLQDRLAEATTLTIIGFAYGNLDQYSTALEFCLKALPIRIEVLDRTGQGVTLSGIGWAYSNLGQNVKALEFYDKALPILREVGDRIDEATALNNIGNVYSNLGQYAKALEFYNKALPVRRDVRDRSGEATTLSNIGLVYWNLGQNAKALEYHNKALQIKRKVGDRTGEAATLNNIGNVYSDLGQYNEALEFFEKALLIAREVRNLYGEAMTLSNVGLVYSHLGRYAKALAFYNKSLPIKRKVRDRSGEATTLQNIGLVYSLLNQNAKALEFYQSALPIEKEVGNRSVEAMTFAHLQVLASKTHPSLSVWYGKRAVNLYQSIRSDIRSLDKVSRLVYKEKVSDFYRQLADLLAGQGRLAEAEQVLRLLKEDELYEFVRRTESSLAGGMAEYTPFESGVDREYEAQTQGLVKIAAEAEKARRTYTQLSKLQALSAEEVKRKQEALTKAKSLAVELEKGEAGFRAFLERVTKKSESLKVKSNRLNRIAEANNGISNILAKLPAHTVAVYALEAPDKLCLFYFTSGTSVGRVSAIKAEDLNKKLLAFRNALTDPQTDPRPLGKELYDLLIKPIAADLAGSQATRIMWSLDDQLRYIPIGALYDGKQFLIEKYDLSIFTPARSADLVAGASTKWQALAAGVSKSHEVRDDLGVIHSFHALTGVPGELSSVMAALPGGKELLDEEFTLDSFKDSLLLQPNLVHLATHFAFLPGNETNSFLLTGDGKAFKVGDARVLSTFSLRGVSLLTLSACETALGGSDGSEIEGIAASLQDKGAESVLATLWPVDDKSTSLLMSEFYRLRSSHPEWNKIEALRQAQLRLLRGIVSGVKSSQTRSAEVTGQDKELSTAQWPKGLPRYSHPYYWAPFVLTGNWK